MKTMMHIELEALIKNTDEPATRTEEILSDPVQLLEVDEKMGFFEQINALILHWDQENRPNLPGHGHITHDLAHRVIHEIQWGPAEDETPGYYALAAALGEFYSTQKVKPAPYNDLFSAVYEYALTELVKRAIYQQDHEGE